MIDLENISLDISNSWVANNMLTDANRGTFVAFDWR